MTTRLHGTDFSWSTLADPLEDNQAEGYLNKYNLGAFSWVLNGEERERTLFIPDDVNTLHLLRFSYAPEPQKE